MDRQNMRVTCPSDRDDDQQSGVTRPSDRDAVHRSSYILMLNNITNDLDILLSEFCQLSYTDTGEPPPTNRPVRINSKKPMHFENCSAFGGSSTSGTLTSTDSNHSNLKSGTLTSTDSNGSVTKPRSLSVQSSHLDVFALSPSKALEVPIYPEKQPSPSRSTSGSDLRQISCLERLTKTHPIWFLPEVGRSGAVHLLKDRDIGIFIVRKSSRDDIMALSVQFPGSDGSPNIDHYLIEPTENGLHLQGSNKLFSAIPNLVAHYCENREDLPHCLVLPFVIQRAKTSQELAGISMLGQDFWTSSKYESQSRSSSRTNLSDHSSMMNKSVSEPISISSKAPVPAYSQSEALMQNTPPKHSVIDFSSYLIQKINPAKDTATPTGASCTQSATNLTESVHLKCSTNEIKQCNHVTATGQVTKCGFCFLEQTGSQKVLVLSEKGADNAVSNRDSQVTVPYAKPNKPRKDKTSSYSSTSLDLLNIPEEYYFRSNLSDKLSDYEDIWKNQYSESNVGSVQADIVQRLQPNMVNFTLGASKDVTTEPKTYTEQCFSDKSMVKDLNVSVDKVSSVDTVSTNVATTCTGKVRSACRTCVSSEKKQSTKETNCEHVIEDGNENVCDSATILHNNSNCDSFDQITSQLDIAAVRKQSFDAIPEHESDVDTDSCHSNSCHSDNEEDGYADTEEGETCRKITSVQTQTSPMWKPKQSPCLSGGTRKSQSALSLSTITKGPVYAEPYDAISPEGQTSDPAPKLPKKMRRRSAPAISLAKRRLGSIECQKLSPLVTHFEGDKTCGADADGNTSPCSDNDLDISTENDLVFEISGDHSTSECVVSSPKVVNGMNGKQEWVVSPLSGSEQQRQFLPKAKVKPTPVPRKTKHSTQSVQRQEEALQSRKSIHEFANRIERLKQKKLQGDVTPTNCDNKMRDPFKFLEDFENNNAPSSPSMNKFPVFTRQPSNDSKVTCSEGSTAEEIISTWNPELTLQPVKPFPLLEGVGAMSEYDNLNSYMAPSGQSVASVGTVFCKPWENSVLGKIMSTHSHTNIPHSPLTTPPNHAPPPLLPSIDTHERIKAWQQSSQKYHSVPTDVEDEQLKSGISDGQSVDAVTFGGDISSMYDNRAVVAGIKSHSHSQSDKTLVNEKSTTHSGGVTDKNSGNIPLYGADFREKVAPILANPRLLNKPERCRNPDTKIRDYIISLSKDRSTTFGSTIENFIQCTLEGHDTNPYNVTRNVRQFMNGIKNYLVKHGEGELEDIIEHERAKLGENEILNIDAILEGALHVCVIQPLKQNIYRLFVNEYTRNGNLQLLSSNMKYARTKTAVEIGIRKELSPPDGATLEMIKQYLTQMQKSYSPLKKLENLLGATSSIYRCVASKQQGNTSPMFGADDFLPMLIYVLVQCGMVSVEIEADYMWGLLHPSLLTGEGGYYLTSLSSAVLVLKNFQEMQETKASQQEGKLPSISDMQGFLKIAIPDEHRDTIMWRTLPVRPSMSTRDVCSMIAHKFKITNPQDYGLYTIENSEESRMMDLECPQMLKADRIAHKKDWVFAYKRHAANIAWPKSVK